MTAPAKIFPKKKRLTMKKRPGPRLHLYCLLALLVFMMLPLAPVEASQSTIVLVEAEACLGDERSRRQTETDAFAQVRRKAAEFAATQVQSETQVKDFEVERDLVSAYAQATVRIIEEVARTWFQAEGRGECFRLRVRAEVIPDLGALAKAGRDQAFFDDPAAPLAIRLWTDRKEYRQGEKIRIYLKGNKPFHARVLFRDVTGTLLQLLPNVHRRDNYFLGGIVYEIPAAGDRFDLVVSPPFGEERIIVYASLAPLGEVALKDLGGVYQVETKPQEVGRMTRGIKIAGKNQADEPAASQFFEGEITIRTRPD
jgi:hypothetical protein